MSRKRPRESSTVMPGGSQRQSNSARSVDVRELSPQSRRRYQSKLSSARLRERQRQRTAEAERDIQQLEVRIQSLQYMIAFYKEQQMRRQEDTHGFTLPSRGISIGQPLPGQPQVLPLQPILQYFLPPQTPPPPVPDSSPPPAGPPSANNTAHQANTNVRELSPESRRRYQSKLSSARLRQRQRERTAAVEEDVRQLETRVLSLQNMIDHVRTRQQSRGIPTRNLSPLITPLTTARSPKETTASPTLCTGAQTPSPPSVSSSSIARVESPHCVGAQYQRRQQQQQQRYHPQGVSSTHINDQFYKVVDTMKSGMQSIQTMICQLSLIRGRIAGVIQEMQPDHLFSSSGGAANLDGGSRISISFLTSPHS